MTTATPPHDAVTRPSISVALCTYNGERFLGAQLDSIASQTLLPQELIVSDDGSTDATIEVAQRFADRAPFAVSIIQNRERLGSTRNFARAIERAEGDLIALCDQDDLWHPNKLSRLVERFADPIVGGVFTDADLIDGNGQQLNGTLWSRGHLPRVRQQHYSADAIGLLMRQDVATGATMLLRAAILKACLPFPKEWVHDAWITWLMALDPKSYGALQLVPDSTISYRVHAAQQTGADAESIGVPSDSIASRLRKARVTGHERHVQQAARLRQLLDRAADRESVPRQNVKRVEGAIWLLGARASLSPRRPVRLVQVGLHLPAYLRFGNGLRSALRDVLA